jgi:Cu/Ag efflux pump CusA
MFGFSFLTVIFADAVDVYFARTRVLERLNSLGDLLPQGVTARLGPDATGLGWVYQYYLKDESGTQDLGRCAPSRIPMSAISSPPCRGWPRSPAWAASCASGRSRSPP